MMATDKQVEAAIVAERATVEAHIPGMAHWPDDYDEAEQAFMRVKMRAALEAAEAAAWEPIETARRDGPRILVEGPHSRGGTYIETTDYWGGRWSIEWMDGYGAPTRWRHVPAPPKETPDAG